MPALLLLCGFSVQAQTTPPQREMRSTWVATVWRLDWPQTVISSTGNQDQINKQKKQMTEMLDSLALNNFNAINFQVRSRSDAMYQSSFEPWSSDLVSERGMDPGYDPLAFVVEECHKRGLECHAWINPYRYESVSHAWDGTPQNYRADHPDWVMDVTNSSGTTASILNPGKPEVTQRICDIIKEIVQNYDVDGILFDDYFYLSGTNTTHDGDLYNDYKAAGGTLTIANWRRANVNSMIAAVYSTIKSTKPWVRFGVSPAGIACTSNSVARQYGIRPCPTGSDWQYSDIYSDPIAWVSSQTLDYISPQIYWTRANGTAYGPATEWWSEVANKWQRHLYVSHSISSLTASSKAPARSAVETDIALQNGFEAAAETLPQGPDYASGPNSTEFQEYSAQVLLNREYNLDDAPGSVFYSAKYLYRTAPKFSHYLKNTVFTTMCLPPAMPWLSAATPQGVENLAQAGTKLTWTPRENMRYTIYAFPNSLPASDRQRLPEYLVGISYQPEFTFSEKYASGYTLGVCAYDRYGNESSLALPGQPAGTLQVPTLQIPAASGTVEAPFEFTWSEVPNAAEYIVEVARDAAMADLLDQRSTSSNSISSDRFMLLPLDTKLYWRVRACCPGYSDGVTQPAAFTVTQLRILTPAANMVTASLTPEFTFSITDRELTLEICTDTEFGQDDIVYSGTHTGNFTLPKYTLWAATEYYARARYRRGADDLVTGTIAFITPEVTPTPAQIAFPTAGGEFYADSHITLAPIEGPKQFRIEISASESFPPRQVYTTTLISTQTFVDPKQGSEIKISTSPLVDGQTYYVHARCIFRLAEGSTETTDYGNTVAFTYRDRNSGLHDAVAAQGLSLSGRTLSALADVHNLQIVTADGRTALSLPVLAQGAECSLDLATGVYILKADGIQPIKIHLK